MLTLVYKPVYCVLDFIFVFFLILFKKSHISSIKSLSSAFVNQLTITIFLEKKEERKIRIAYGTNIS